MKQLLLVAKETYIRQVKSWAFVGMVFGPFLFMFLSLGMGYLGSQFSSGSSKEIALITKNQELAKNLSSLSDFTRDYKEELEAEQAVKDEDLLGYVTIAIDNQQIQVNYHGNGEFDGARKASLLNQLDILQSQFNQEALGLTEEQTSVLNRKVEFKEEINSQKELQKNIQSGALMGLIFVIYLILIIYASTTAQEVANEKGTKIMEVIFSSLPASHYFYGRLLAILGVIVTHLGIYVIGGMIGVHFVSSLSITQNFLSHYPEIPQLLSQAISLNTLLFAGLGVLVYVALSAFCGSLVTRPEDANKAVQPVVYIVMIGFFGVLTLNGSGDSLLLKIGSYIPFVSTFFMPARVINGYASSVEAWLSLLVLVLFSIGFIFYIGKIYGSLVLQTDDIGLWKSFKRALTYSK